MIDFSLIKSITIPEGNVTQIADTQGNVLWSSTIKFTINGDTYIADRGMTWAEWFASDYNTTGETEGDIKDANGNEVSLDAVIVGGTAYEVGFAPPFNVVFDFGTITATKPQTGGYYSYQAWDLAAFDLSECRKCNILILDGVEYEMMMSETSNYRVSFTTTSLGRPIVSFEDVLGSWGVFIALDDNNPHSLQFGYYEE